MPRRPSPKEDNLIFNVPALLKPELAALLLEKLRKAEWVDGRLTAKSQAVLVKNNLELKGGQPLEAEAITLLISSLEANRAFNVAALPKEISRPIFNRYQTGQSYGSHSDNAVTPTVDPAGRIHPMRGDLSATLFLSEPADYDGGELVVEDTYGTHSVKLPAGHLVLYPAGSIHEVKPVTRGDRFAAIFWIQSMVRDDGQRALLVELELAIQGLHRDHPSHPSMPHLTGIYNNLLRRWAET